MINVFSESMVFFFNCHLFFNFKTFFPKVLFPTLPKILFFLKFGIDFFASLMFSRDELFAIREISHYERWIFEALTER